MSDAEHVGDCRRDIARLDDGLVALESGDAGGEDVDELFRTAHSLKGRLAMLGHEDAAELVHAVEDVLGAVRSGALDPPPAAVIDRALDATAAADEALAAVDADRTPDDPTPVVEAVRDRLAAHRSSGSSGGNGPDPTGDGGGRAGGGTGRGSDGPASPSDEDLTAEEALAAAAEFDDLEALAEEVDDAEAFAGLDGGGSFDEILDRPEADGATADDPGRDLSPDPDPDPDQDPDPARGQVAGSDTPAGGSGGVATAESDGTAGTDPAFEAIKSSVEEPGVDQLQTELEGVEFGELHEADDMTIDELLAIEPTDAGTPAAEPGPAAAAGSDAPEADEGDAPAPDAAEFGGFERATVDAWPGAAGTEADPGGDRGDAPNAATDAATTDGPLAGTLERVLSAIRSVVGLDARDRRDDESGTDPGRGTADGTDRDARPAERASGSGATGVGRRGETATGGRAGPDPDAAAAASGPAFTRDSDTAAFEERFADAFGHDESESRATPPATTLAESAFDPPGAEAGTEGDGGDGTPGGTGGTLTVDAGRVDELLSLTEMVTANARRLSVESDDVGERSRGAVADLESAAASLRRLAVEIRLTRVEGALDGLQRVAREAARATDTSVELTIEGGDVTADRAVVDAVEEPLVHLVRNAVDHGIEPPERRREAGKPTTGRVEVDVRRRCDRLILEVRDDGRGIDPDEVRERAVAAGLVSRAEADRLDGKGAYELLFDPGFSTHEEVTAVSGRGVGMDVVADAVEALGGSVDVESEVGVGTAVRLSLPVRVAVTDVLPVTVGDETYALPARGVEAIGRAADAADRSGAAAADDGTVDLATALDVAGDPAADGVRIRVDCGDDTTTLRCDAVGERQEVVVDAYDDLLAAVPGVSGAAVIDGDRLVNVLDVDSL